MKRRLDLNQYTSPGVRVFSGRGRGKAVRKHAGIEAGDHVIITAPQNTICLTFSFVWELLRGCTAEVVNDEYHNKEVQRLLKEQKRVESLGPFTL